MINDFENHGYDWLITKTLLRVIRLHCTKEIKLNKSFLELFLCFISWEIYYGFNLLLHSHVQVIQFVKHVCFFGLQYTKQQSMQLKLYQQDESIYGILGLVYTLERH